MLAADPSLFAPEIRPAMDEVHPKVGPNLANDEQLCKDVAQYVCSEFFYPYWLQQQRYLEIWNRIDNMWRGTASIYQLDLGIVQRQSGENDNAAQMGGFGTQNPFVGWQAKVSPAAAHKQMDAITTLGCTLSFEDGDIPMQARRPRTVYENPAYNPVEQSVRVANEEMRRQAEEIDLKNKYRIGFGNFVKYGHSWALRDFARQLETVECRHALPDNPEMVNAALMQLRTYYKYPENRFEMDEYGRNIVVFLKTIPKVMHTNYIPLDVSSVFIDDLLPCTPMERQPCPIVKLFMTRWELEGNAYEPTVNPFGWLNVEKAIDDNTHQWVLSQSEEQELRNRLMKRWGANSFPGIQRPENTVQTLWTAYALLAIGPDGKLYTRAGDGPQCQRCEGRGKMMMEDGTTPDCEACKGRGKVAVKSERYVVQMFGDIFLQGVTVLRIQRNPTAKDKVPILFAAHLVEDTATARPVSKSEIAISAYEQLATAHNQFLDSKSRTINRGWMKRTDSLAYNINCNQPNVVIPIESSMENEVRRVEANNLDETATLIPYMQMMEGEVEQVYGVNDTVLGEISAGRRAASEISLANEGSKRPLVQMIDQFNKSHMGGLGQAMLDDIESWSDRDFMVQLTGGSATWGKVEMFTAVGEEMLGAQAAIAQYRYLLEMFGGIPALQPLLPKIAAPMLEAMKLPVSADDIDQGYRASQQKAFEILTTILGEGVPLMPNQDDPHEIYLGVFTGCMNEIAMAMQSGKQNYWVEKAPQNIPLLQQRIQLQQQLLAIQQQQMMMQQLQQQALASEAAAAGKPENEARNSGDEPKRPGKPATTPGQERQKTGA